jgi:hypothetical protein
VLVPAPNAQLGNEGRDRWLVSPGSVGSERRHQLCALGRLLGASARGGAFMELDLAAPIWKLLLGESLATYDLEAVDQRIVEFFAQLRAIEDEDAWTVRATQKDHQHYLSDRSIHQYAA